MDGLRRWVGVDQFFLTLFFFGSLRVEKTKRNRRKGCGWLVKVAAGTEDNEDSKGTRTNRWSVAGSGGWVGATNDEGSLLTRML